MDDEVKLTERQKDLLSYANLYDLCGMISEIRRRFGRWSDIEKIIPCDQELKDKILATDNALGDLHKALSQAHYEIMNKDENS